jgi:[acyl-carrier-protein] S-malonyltransferase
VVNFAMIFPGQGSQSVGMLADLAVVFPEVENLFERASSLLGYDLWQMIQSDPHHQLDQTEYTQPAVFVADLAVLSCWEVLGGGKPSLVAGHSLGEYAALVCAESLIFEDALSLVAERGRQMQHAVRQGLGAMAALIGLENKQIELICHDAAQGAVLSPANFNAIGQTVIAGESRAVERAILLAKKAGAKMAQLIPVSVPSHCALMEPAARALQDKLKQTPISPPQLPVIQNFSVSSSLDPEKIREGLLEQLTQPVRWVETIQFFVEQKIDLLIECGPGKILSGLNKRISQQIFSYPTQTPLLLEAAVAVTKGEEHDK